MRTNVKKRDKMKDNSNKSGSTIPLLVLLIILLLIIAFGITRLSGNGDIEVVESYSSDESEQSTTEEVTEEVTETETEPIIASKTELDISNYDIYSESALLMSIDGTVMYSLNADERIYPASLTKIMTAIVALENISDIDDDVVIPGDIYDYIIAEQASTAGFESYEDVTYRDLLYGAVLSSGAECCLTLASYLAGSEDMFVDMMNDKAEELGMNGTHFTNVCGLHNYDHYSTAMDISILLNYALKNSDFREIFTSSEYYTETDLKPDGITLQSTMFSVLSDRTFEGGELLGGKTGYTSEAGLCLASLANVNGREYTLVTMGADGSHETEPLHIYDARKIYETLAQAQSGYSSEYLEY